MVNSAGVRLLEGLLPNHCALCRMRSYRHLPLCRPCESELPANTVACKQCAIPLAGANHLDAPRLCGQCLAHPPPYDRVIAPWLYGEYLARLIQRWKYQRERHLTRVLAHLWLQRAGSRRDVDLLVPVPLHWRRRWHRGFNQSELLAFHLGDHVGVAGGLTPDLCTVKRHQPTAPQSVMSAAQRKRNLANAFTVSRPCDNLRIAIVDDVLTTGATAAALSRALKQAGARHIEVWCLARTPTPYI